MKICVLSLCRDRLEYTQRSFASLRQFAGISFDHFILDQGSTDGTVEWLQSGEYECDVTLSPENRCIARGMNMLLTVAGDYDVVVKLDNDCELVQPNTLRDVCRLVAGGGNILSPRICGLNNPPYSTGEYVLDGETILDIPQIGGIFLAAPAHIFGAYQYPEDLPTWGRDDSHICHWYRQHGGRCGYVKRLEAWHMDTTSGQHAKFPSYFARTLSEGKAVL